ncbi:helix-turn-helix domain-containing protein [Streptomyces odonnellii]|uniref:helix-turn-helix domain-containing protein n=1 Tax=Streptomyces odonnellii TaxID=1417980 RepID=UPI000625D44D|nr:helix-turn-helix domain-containing protein [Streptomyces odonnellii]
MYDLETRKRAIALVLRGHSLNAVSRQTGISRAAIRSWQSRIEPLPRMAAQARPCPRCRPEPGVPDDPASYAYLLGLYLGDGCISAQPRTGYQLRIACADAWPGLIVRCQAAITAVRAEDRVYVLQRQGCVMVTSYGQHWPCLFPQHGPGKKHNRSIVLEPWQQRIVRIHPWELLRGLIHSDGCRVTNWTSQVVAGEKKRYEYPRYFFSNLSADILRLYTDTLNAVGVAWRQANEKNISVAKRASVALMDAHIGGKY